MTLVKLVADVRRGDRRALARAITLAERSPDDARRLQEALDGPPPRPHVVGVTGPPGVGKSTLIDGLAGSWHRAGRPVCVLAIDPTSPRSGGALLGDRVRQAGSPDAPFFRSLATRGGQGALARATGDVLQLVAAAGCDPVLLETVGAGQAEVGVTAYAQTTVVVLAPGMGDAVQLGKAGLLEFGQILVVNKADLAGAAQFQAALRGAAAPRDGWTPPVLATQAHRSAGLEELSEAVARHFRHLGDTGRLDALARRAASFHIQEILRARFEDWLTTLAGDRQAAPGEAPVASARSLYRLGAEVAAGRSTPHAVAATLWQDRFPSDTA